MNVSVIKAQLLKVYEYTPWIFHFLRFFHYRYYSGIYTTYRYDKHFKEARHIYKLKNKRLPTTYGINDLTVEIFKPTMQDNDFTLPDRYIDLVKIVHHGVSEKIQYTHNCLFFPKINKDTAPKLVKDIHEIQEGRVISIQLKEPLDIVGLNEMIEPIIKELESKYYGCYLLVDKVYIYRNLISSQENQGSWLWHFDNHPNVVTKAIICLNDVGENTGAFEFFRSSKTGKVFKFNPIPGLGKPFFPTRVSKAKVGKLKEYGYKTEKLIGPQGTTAFFSENILHKANIPEEGCRDAVVLMLRPAHQKFDPLLSREYVGSFNHEDLIMNPYNVAQNKKAKMASG
jgi:hypothetical protein